MCIAIYIHALCIYHNFVDGNTHSYGCLYKGTYACSYYWWFVWNTCIYFEDYKGVLVNCGPVRLSLLCTYAKSMRDECDGELTLMFTWIVSATDACMSWCIIKVARWAN